MRLAELGNGRWNIPQLGAALAEVVERDVPFRNLEIEVDAPDAERRVLLCNGSCVSRQESAQPLVLLAMEDVTAIRTAEAGLWKSEQSLADRETMLNAFLDNPLAALAIFDEDLRFVRVGRTNALAFLGGAPEQMIGRSLTEIDLGLTKTVDPHFRALLEKNAPVTREVFYVDPQGRERYVIVSGVPLRYADGRRGVASALVDVTERRKAEEAFRESEGKYRTLVEHANDGIVIIQDGIIQFANPKLAEVEGISVEDLSGSPYTQHFYPHEVPKLSDMYRRRIAGEKLPSTYETVMQRRDGTTVPVELNAALITYRGRPADLVIIRDISQRKQAEDALKKSEREFKALAENSPDSILRYDRHARILYANPKASVIFNRTREQMIGKSNREIGMPQPGAHYWDTVVRETIETKKERTVEFEVPSLKKCFIAIVVPEAGEGGEIVSVLTISRDITALKETGRSLQRSEREFRTLAQNLPDIIARYDRLFRYLYINPAGEKLWGKSREDIIGRTDAELGMPAELLDLLHSHFKKIIKTEREDAMEFSVPVQGGLRHISWRMVPEFDAQGNLVSLLSINHDITELKEIEREAKRRAAEAENGAQILHTLMDNLPEGLMIADAGTSTVRMMSSYMARITGISQAEAIGKSVDIVERTLSFVEPAAGNAYPLQKAIRQGESTFSAEGRVVKPDGETLRVLINAVPIRDREGGIAGALTVWRDITELKKASDLLRRNEYELRTLVDNSPDLIVRFDRLLRYVYVNPAYEQLTGMRREQLTGRTNTELGMPAQLERTFDDMTKKVVETGHAFSLEFDIASFFGKRYFLGRMIPEFAKSGLVETVMLIARDITERRRAEERIRFISFHDPVTGLFNRAFFEEEVRRTDTERELPVSIIMGDVNYLKLSNDVFGHREGDLLLKAIADAFRNACRRNDIIARWGGDEYAVILPETDGATAEEACRRIKQLAGAAEGTVVRPSIALGVATKEQKDRNIYQVIRQAEERMYNNKIAESKENEKNVLSSLTERAQTRTPGLPAHLARTADLARRFGKTLGLEEDQLLSLLLLVRMHNVGLAVIPPEILARPGRLSEEEWAKMKKHSDAGYRIVKSFPDTARISNEVLCADERWDGSGYPRGLKGKDIPYLSRILSIIDAFDVMTHGRPYARSFTQTEAIEELQSNAGRQFDPELVEIFVRQVAGREPVEA
jgi:diguanylate cyclase (GGDEF)-like protein/PAS domain S-box-containing protein